MRSGVDTPKSEAGERTISLGARIAAELFEHRRQTAFVGDEERVFCSPTKGTAFDVVRFAETFRLALGRAKIEDRVRPFHDLRHSFGSLAARAATTTRELQEWMGHADAKTTARYTHYRPRGGEASRLAAAFALADPASALQPDGLHEPAVSFRSDAAEQDGFPAQTAFSWNAAERGDGF